MNRIRLVFLAAFIGILFCSLIVRFYQIQILQGSYWTKLALNQHQFVVTEPFKRGCFFSNTTVKKGHPEEDIAFVVDVQKFHLFIDPDSIPERVKTQMVQELYQKFHFDPDFLKKEFFRKSRSRKIASWLEKKEKDLIEAWWNQFYRKEKIVRNAIFFTSEYRRSYPFGSMLGSVLHTVQEEKDPKDDQAIPTGGLEYLFHPYLKGKKGKKLIVRSPRHPLDSGKILESPENGADVYLTINHYLQALCESELEKGIQAVNARGGWAMMMDPFTGEILALAQFPNFNPTHYKQYYNDPQKQDCTKAKVVTDCFEPGSIFKPITTAIALTANEEWMKSKKKLLFNPEEWIACSNGWFPGRSSPLKDARCYQFLNMDIAMQKSSNIYMAKLIQKVIESMGDRWYRNALTEIFGFGKKTQVELPAESPGLVPSPGKIHPNGKLEWSAPTPYSLAIGHNILINSVQMVRAYAILANGGFEVTPHLVRKIVKKNENGSHLILLDRSSNRLGKQVLKTSIAKRVCQAMKYVTKEGGSGRRADVYGYTEAGKSGTAEKIIGGEYSKSKNISSFLGFAPANNPRFVLLVSIDEPESKFIPGVGKQQYGGVCAAPIFREIATGALQYLGVEPDDPFGYPIGDPRRDLNRADMTAELQKLKKDYQKYNP